MGTREDPGVWGPGEDPGVRGPGEDPGVQEPGEDPDPEGCSQSGISDPGHACVCVCVCGGGYWVSTCPKRKVRIGRFGEAGSG